MKFASRREVLTLFQRPARWQRDLADTLRRRILNIARPRRRFLDASQGREKFGGLGEAEPLAERSGMIVSFCELGARKRNAVEFRREQS
ncbi:MAG: hypothetical protein EDS66_02440 [Planctomycetota bacterium]|nr:MAG: hypothetical protein EDS66_02440 [Planctomycetota bacterium]MCQ3920528.1 hypothetical protein [Planctomycetota bacterium]